MRTSSAASLTAIFAMATLAHAAKTDYEPTPYLQTSDSPFSGKTYTYFQLEDFEDGALNTPGATGNASVVGPGGLTDSVDKDDGTIDGSGTNGHSYFGDGATGITISFDGTILGSLPTDVGLVWTDGAGNGNTVTFQAFDSSNVLITSIIGNNIGADNSNVGGTAEDRFFGVSSTTPIAKSSCPAPETAGASKSITFNMDRSAPALRQSRFPRL